MQWHAFCVACAMSDSLRIVVISASLEVDNPADANALNLAERSRSLRICLLENGYNLIAVLPVDVFLEQRLRQLQPDLIILDAESEARDALEHVVTATRDERRPIVMFTNDNNSSNARAAVAAGVSAYVVAGLSAERIRPILDVALARFEQEQQLRHELASTRNELHELSSELKDRKTIDRAKALLMKRQALSEDAAYAKLRKTAMDKNLKIVEVAQRILDVADLLS
jgi:response regulator NasT